MQNCTVEFLDEMVKYTEFYNSTDYTTRADYNAYSNGNYHTGDANNTDRLCYASFTPKAANAPMYGTQIILSADGENYFSITNARSTSLTASTKKANLYGFRPEHILYYSGSATIAVGNKTSTSAIYESLPFTATYSYKGKALTDNSSVYLVATYDEESDLFTLVSDNWMTCDESTTEDGLYYIMLGYSYNTTALYLKPDHIVRQYKNGAFRDVNPSLNEPFVVTITPTSQDLSSAEADKTFAEIYEAHNAGRQIKGHVNVIDADLMATAIIPPNTQLDMPGLATFVLWYGETYTISVTEGAIFVNSVSTN